MQEEQLARLESRKHARPVLVTTVHPIACESVAPVFLPAGLDSFLRIDSFHKVPHTGSFLERRPTTARVMDRAETIELARQQLLDLTAPAGTSRETTDEVRVSSNWMAHSNTSAVSRSGLAEGSLLGGSGPD